MVGVSEWSLSPMLVGDMVLLRRQLLLVLLSILTDRSWSHDCWRVDHGYWEAEADLIPQLAVLVHIVLLLLLVQSALVGLVLTHFIILILKF